MFCISQLHTTTCPHTHPHTTLFVYDDVTYVYDDVTYVYIHTTTCPHTHPHTTCSCPLGHQTLQPLLSTGSHERSSLFFPCAGIYPFVSLGAPDVAATFVEGLHEPQTPRDFTSRVSKGISLPFSKT